jgi:hypothetical protein
MTGKKIVSVLVVQAFGGIRGAFNNYMDQILSNLTAYPSLVEYFGHFTYYLPFVHMAKCGLY